MFRNISVKLIEAPNYETPMPFSIELSNIWEYHCKLLIVNVYRDE